MPSNQDTLFRQWHMLRLLPRYPHKITAQTIVASLEAAGFEITQRSIQRDLKELSLSFPIYCDDRDKPFGWSWIEDAPCFDLPALSVPESLTLAMAELHLRDLLPAPMVELLQPYFKAARQRLDSEPKPRRGRSWLDKVRTVPPAQPLLPPKIVPAVQQVVSEALLYERQIAIQYLKRGSAAPVEYRIHPLALIQRGPLLYLYCRIFDYEEGRTLALHRIVAATLLDEAAKYPVEFSLDDQIELGTWGFGPGRIIRLELIFLPGYGDHLHETPLSCDQTTDELADGRLHVKASVAETPQLEWWLMSFGDGVEVISPANLRDSIARTAERMAIIYRQHA